MRGKAAPKSVKQKALFKHMDLGDSTESSSNDVGSPERSVSFKRPGNKRVSAASPLRQTKNQSEFRSPEQETNVTDYGLEFSTSRINRNNSHRRCSTFQKATDLEDERTIIGNQKRNKDQPHVSGRSLRETTANQQKTNSHKADTQKQKKTNTNATVATTVTLENQAIKKPRKQRNPLQIEQRFWKEVKYLQNKTTNLIPMLPFSRLVRELMHEASHEVTKITPTAMEALQTSAEIYITQTLHDAYMLTLHRARVTLDVRDLRLIKYLMMYNKL